MRLRAGTKHRNSLTVNQFRPNPDPFARLSPLERELTLTGQGMLEVIGREAFNTERAFRPHLVTDKPAIAVIGLGYVGAVSAGCLARFGHRIVGVDLDAARRATVGQGRAPIHEAGLDALLSEACENQLLSVTDDIVAAVADTDITFVSVGTPTAADGGCDTRQIEAAARAIGTALAAKSDFHAVVLRCSVPPGTTHGVMGRLLEETSGKVMGVDFGVAFVPEFLREGVAVEDFHAPPKTVIGASDDRTARIVARIFDPVDAAPILSEIETAELVKYVDNVWHATKVCFANEVGRLARAKGVDGREVMEIFCEDRKLNISPAYLKPGFAYGGSCLPKEVRAVGYLAREAGVAMPLVDSLATSNEAQVAEALRLVRATGARRVAVLGLAFKPGTDDLRESPVLDVMAALMAEGVSLVAHDAAVTAETPIAKQLTYVAHGAPGLACLAEALPGMLRATPGAALAEADAVLVTHAREDYRAALEDQAHRRGGIPVVDAAQLFAEARSGGAYAGLGW